MGKYTVLEDPRVDEFIDEYLQRVVEALVDNMPGIRSIILTGSFGKGEGSVLLDNQGVKPLRDFDLVVIFKGKVPSVEFVKALQKNLQEKYGSLRVDDKYYLLNDLVPEIKATTLERVNSFPDISTYDLKQCIVLYGEDVRSKIKWDLKDLPLRTNARALLQKAIALIGAFHSDYLNKEIPPSLRDSFLRETSRAYIEICVGLCLLANRYDSSGIRRLEIVREIYEDEFPELYKKVPDLAKKMEVSTKYKLDPSSNPLRVNSLDYWFETRDDLGAMITYYYGRYLNLTFKDWAHFSTALEEGLREQYYLPLIDAFLRSRNLPTNFVVSNLSNFFFNIRENIAYSRMAFKDRHFSVPLLYGISSPAIKVLSATPLVLFAINRDGSINSKYVDLALRKLKFVKIDTREHKSAWEEARAKFLEAVFSVNMI